MDKNRKQLKWTLAGSLPGPILVALYIIIDIASSSSWHDFIVAFFILSLLSLVISGIAIWRVKGWYKLLPVVNKLHKDMRWIEK